MANCYTHCAAQNTIPCSEEDFQTLEGLLSVAEQEAEENDENPHGMVVTRCDGQLHMHDDCGSAYPENIGLQAQAKIADILRKAGLEFWEFGIAHTCDKPRPKSYGGDLMRFTADGRHEFQNHSWPAPDGVTHWIISGRIPGQDEDTTLYICSGPDEDPTELFVKALYDGRELAPEEMKEFMDGEGFIMTDPETEEPYAYINSRIQIPGPPIQ